MFQQDITLGPGTGTFTSHTLEILMMLLVAFVLGIWLGWTLWSRYRQEAAQLRLDLSSANASLNTLRTDLESVKGRLTTAVDDATHLRNENDRLTRDLEVHREHLASTESQLAQALHRIRQLETELGLGANPPAAGYDNQAGIAFQEEEQDDEIPDSPAPGVPASGESEVFEEAAALEDNTEADTESPATTIRVIDNESDHAVTVQLNQPVPHLEIRLESEGKNRDELPDSPGTTLEWGPGYEELEAHNAIDPGDGTEIKPLQIDAVDLFDTPGFIDLESLGGNDLTRVSGISPEVQEVLQQYGIRSLAQLAETPAQQLRVILREAGLEHVEAGSWPRQAIELLEKR